MNWEGYVRDQLVLRWTRVESREVSLAVDDVSMASGRLMRQFVEEVVVTCKGMKGRSLEYIRAKDRYEDGGSM